MASRSTPRNTKLKEGLRIGDYVLREEIGFGSFAMVHRAKNVHGGYAAVKCVILSKINNNKKLKENLYGEIKILKSLNHPHIVSLFDCRDSPDFIYLIMEFCPMGDLSHFIKHRKMVQPRHMAAEVFSRYPCPDHGGLNEVLVRHFVKQLASAVDFLQTKNLIHRDLKPQNVLLSPSRQSSESAKAFLPERIRDLQPVGVPSLPVLQIADFGFARSLPPHGLAETLCGSPLYMAPEILRYEKYDAKADLWSIGTVTYEMISGRPPFRAGNHVELLRTIEKGDDVIRFAESVQASPDLRDLIRKLLKRNPVQRTSFEDFFNHTVVTGPIPNLREEDRQQLEALSRPKETQAAAMQRTLSAQRKEDANPVKPGPETPISKDVFVDALDHRPGEVPVRPKPEKIPTSPPEKVPRLEAQVEKPIINRHNTEMPPPTSSASAARRPDAARRHSVATRQDYRASPPVPSVPPDNQDEQERAAQDVADEREYVVVEKRAVEMNALADELQASPRIQSHRYSVGSQQRPSRQNGFQPSSAPTSNQVATTRAVQATTSNKPDHLRRTSFERRAKSGSSASSAIAKALNLASGRLLTLGFSPPMSRGTTSPNVQIYNPFPAYPAQASQYLLEEGKPSASLDEDNRALQTIEETATRSDVVYGFAEIKYMQIAPAQPSAEHGLGLRGPGLESANTQNVSEESGDLPPEALVTICEEALVLYVKALSLCARAMDVAGGWWARRNRGEAADQAAASSRDTRSNNSAAAVRLNSVVQWVRQRFNLTLEKAEFVRLKLVGAQKLLPPDHPSHPSNHSAVTLGLSPSALQIAGGQVVGVANKDNAGHSVDVYVSPGVTADRIMYQRAVEMSRSAAINELMNEDLDGCEISYITAIRMLEVVLESSGGGNEKDGDGSGKSKDTGRSGDRNDGDVDLLDPEDRESVLKMLQGTKKRLHTLRIKIQQMTARRNSTQAIPQRSPKARPAQLAPANASAR